jgi:uncharacterized damage-inducible protein DinB
LEFPQQFSATTSISFPSNKMMIDYPRLFAYDRWANEEVLRALKTIAAPPQRSTKLIAHIIGTQYVWHSRMTGTPNTIAVWPEWDVRETEANSRAIADGWQEIAARAGEDFLEREFSYKNSKGEQWTSRNDDVLMHVIMHGAYHRGQIAADIRAHGFEPPYTDYVQAARAGLLP